MADALVAGTPGTVAEVVMEDEAVVDEPVEEVVAIDAVNVDAAAQPVSKHPTIIRDTNIFTGLIRASSSPHYLSIILQNLLSCLPISADGG